MIFLKDLKRTCYCGEVTSELADQTLVLMGWVDSRRDHGRLIFLDLRDRQGFVQIVLDPVLPGLELAHKIRGEFVIAVQGLVKMRPEGMQNLKISTGQVEVHVQKLEILSESQPLPYQVDDPNVNEITRLKYRYLDLRSPRMQKNLKLRHDVTQFVRSFLSTQKFLEIETPILYKSTPEGARDYLVPSRVNLGHFYALPQSPQTLKQILMISGYDRYFQIARCFRDEDLRADRQPEFTQIDIEMSFIDEDDIMEINEKLLASLWKTFKGVDIGPVVKKTFREVMDLYGSDKPDLRFDLRIQDLGSFFEKTSFSVFEDILKRGGFIRGLPLPGQGSQSRSYFDKLTELAKTNGAKGLVWIKWGQDKIQSSVSKFFSDEELKQICQKLGAGEGDGAVLVADDYEIVCQSLGALRSHLGHSLNLIDFSRDSFLWVIDFPLFEFSPEDKRWVARHHPFTSPKNKDLEILIQGQETHYGQCLAKAYDLVCNGYEVAGGSIRIFKGEVQQAMFQALGLTPEDTKQKFGFFIEALKYGTPPHGGIAWGLDRLIMLLAGTQAIREVIAFPKTAKATDLMSDCPSLVNAEQLLEVGIRLTPTAEKNQQ
jgi:aspartyl-tRNA synthetase